MKNNNKKNKTASTTLLSVALMIGTAAMITLAPTNNIFLQEAYAQLVEIEQEAESENGVHTGSISIKVEPQGEPDDEPAHRGVITHILPNDRVMFRVIESAPQSSSAAAGQSASNDGVVNEDNDD